MSHRQAVERPHGIGVEEHGAVDNASQPVGQQLQVCKVGGYHAEASLVVQPFKHRFGYCATRTWLGAAAQLVEQKHCPLVGSGHQCFHVLQVRRICAEVVVYALLVANVDDDAAENATLRGGP